MRFGFGQIEAALQAMHGVGPAKVAGFRARLRYLHRVDIGVPRAGVGRRANFTIGHALLFAVALELEQFGMTPERVARTLHALGFAVARATLREAVFEAAERLGTERPAVLIWFYPDALNDTVRAADDRADMSESTITWSELEGLPSDLFVANGRLARLAIVNLSAVVTHLIQELGEGAGEMKAALIEWANNEEAE